MAPRKRKQRPSSPAGSPAGSGPQRLQRLLAAAGYGSRRQCEALIEEGRVDVDGTIVTKLGTTVDVETEKVRVDGVLLKKQKRVYYAVNKPVGVVTTNRDPQGRPRVVDLVPPNERVFAVGRLDRSSEGLILLTNDGELSQRLTHPRFGIRKVYRVVVAGKVENETMRKMRKGIHIAEGFVKVEGAKLVKARPRATELEVILKEGKNREIRRILARLGHKVQQLRRIAVGPLRLGDLPTAAHRSLTREEVDKLWTAVENNEKAANAASSKNTSSRRSSPSKPNTDSPKRSTQSAKRPTKASKRSTAPAKTKPPATKPPATKRTRRDSSTSASPGDFLPITQSRTVGAVIGGDDPAPQTSKKTKRAQNKTANRKQASAGRRSGTKKSNAKRTKKSNRKGR